MSKKSKKGSDKKNEAEKIKNTTSNPSSGMGSNDNEYNEAKGHFPAEGVEKYAKTKEKEYTSNNADDKTYNCTTKDHSDKTTEKKNCDDSINERYTKKSTKIDKDKTDKDEKPQKEYPTNDNNIKGANISSPKKSVDVESEMEKNVISQSSTASGDFAKLDTASIVKKSYGQNKNFDDLIAEPKSEFVAAAEENKDQPPPSETAVRPNNRDVLFGRGKPFQNHPGNRKMLGLIDQYKRQYNESPRDQKRPIVEEIIGILSSDGGRFLRRYNDDANSTWWTEVPKQIAFDKVSHAFRSRGRPKSSQSATTAAAVNKGHYIVPQSTIHPHLSQHHLHQQHQYPHHPQYHPHQHYKLEGQHSVHQYMHGPGISMAHYPVMTAAQQPHSAAMMGYHPMPPGMSPQQQAMMQAGMMVVMQQQQQHYPGTYGQAHPQSLYHHQQQNFYYGQQQYQPNKASIAQGSDLIGSPVVQAESTPTNAATGRLEGHPLSSEGIESKSTTCELKSKSAKSSNMKTVGTKAENTQTVIRKESKKI